MPPSHSDYGRLDDAALATGFGLVLLGLAAMGVFETVIGSAHFTEHVPGVGVVVVVHTSFSPHLRASIVALGFFVLLVWSFVRMGRAIIASVGGPP